MAKQTFTTGQVLSATQVNALQTNDFNQTVSAKTVSYVLVAADAGTRITMNSASATTITVNTALFAAGDTLQITNLGAGVLTITAGTATVSTAGVLTLAQNASGSLYFTSTGVSIWAGSAAVGGGVTLLSTTSLSGVATTVTSIDQTYRNLFIVISGLTASVSSGEFYIEPNSEAALCNTSGVTNSTNFSTQDNAARISASQQPLRTDANNVWNVTFFNYASTTAYKSFSGSGGFEGSAANSGTKGIFFGGTFKTNTALSSLKFVNNGNTMTAGTVLIFGVK